VATALQQGKGPRAPRLPSVLRWDEPGTPLPMRVVRVSARARARVLGREAPPWLDTGPHRQPFDFCGHVRRLCADVVCRSPALYHVDVARLLFSITQARGARRRPLQARVTPLRCRDGRLTRQCDGVAYQVQRYFVAGHEMLYLVTFCLPRFLDQSFEEKFITLFHELHHISPAFDGDLRRYAGRCEYDARMADEARSYLATRPDPALHAFLRLNFAQLQHRHGSVVGVVVPRPKLLPVVAARS
jgi:hypothetical protein